MHFTYRTPEDFLKNADLSQGDILERTPAIDELLKKYHPYYEQNDQNKYFIVLTQTCDLVRGRGDPCKSKYITISPVRTLTSVIQKHINLQKDKRFNFERPLCTEKNKTQLNNFLERLFNNNETDYFYLHEDKSQHFPESCCALLRLSISLKSKDNYDICMDARILGLNESFRDKLGWALGQIYSRVGTEDWPPKVLQGMLNEHISDVAIWVSDKNLKELNKDFEQWNKDNVGDELTLEIFDGMLKSLKTKKDSVLHIIETELNSSPTLTSLIDNGNLRKKDVTTILNRLKSHPLLSSLLK